MPSGGIKIPGMPSGGIKMPGGIKIPGMPSGGIKMPKVPKLLNEVLTNIDSAPFKDAAAAFIKHNIGGYDGPLSELDLSRESNVEIIKAIERAKKRTSTEIRKAEMKIKELQSSGATKTLEGKIALATQRSFLNKLNQGIIRVQYTDYRNEKGGVTKDAKNAQLILGQFWAHSRSKEEGGGYRVEDKYDFKSLTVKDSKTGKSRDMTNEELWNNVVMGKNKTLKQKLQAIYLLNPLKGRGDVDMVLGGKRSFGETSGLAGSKTLIGGMLGMSGSPKPKNQQTLESKRPVWDRLGLFGGRSAQIERDKQKDSLKRTPSVKLYNKPKPNTGTPYSSRFAIPKNAGVRAPKPPGKGGKPRVSVVNPTRRGRTSAGSAPVNSSKPPAFASNHRRSRGMMAPSVFGVWL